MKRINRDRLRALQILSRNLGRITFKPLQRPDVPSNHPTKELLDWAIKLYCFSILSHFRELLRSLVFLSKAGHVPAVFIIARSLFELGAHSYYVRKHIGQYRKSNNVGEGWKFMLSINMGRLYRNQKATTGAGSEKPFPLPRDIGKIIRCFDEWPERKPEGFASATYGFLSEFAHPNMGALAHYYSMEPNAQRKIFAILVDPPRDVDQMPLPEISMAVVATLYNICKLSSQLGEQDVAEKCDHCLRSFMAS